MEIKKIRQKNSQKVTGKKEEEKEVEEEEEEENSKGFRFT